MAKQKYTTPFRSGSWSVAVTEHHRAGVNSGLPERQAASYEADQGRVHEIAKSALAGYTTLGGSRPDQTPERMSVGRSSTPTTVVAHGSTGRPDEEISHASVRIFTPEGHELARHHVEGLMAGTHNAQDLREEYADNAEQSKQGEFEQRVKRHIWLHGGLPHSGVDALMAQVPTATSPAGAQIMRHVTPDGRGSAHIDLNADFPHYSGDTSLENPAQAIGNKRYAKYMADQAAKAPSPQDRGGDDSRVVDHR
jgi:hypothetical protein